MGADLSALGESVGCLGSRLFVGTLFTRQTYYLAGAGDHRKKVLEMILRAVQQRGPTEMKVSSSQVKGFTGLDRDVIAIRWSIGYAYVVCFAPGKDLFISVRVTYQPGCLARMLAILPWFSLEPNVFDVDDLRMLAYCVTTTTQEQLDALQLSYMTRGSGAWEK